MHDLKKILADVGIPINKGQLSNFKKYIDLILRWNKRTNLISRKDESKIFENHILGSLAFLISFKFSPGAKVIDVGSGAGFPALPISLIQSDVNFLLVESKRMKALFLKEVVSQLKIKNVDVVCERVENLTQNPEYENRFDYAFSRAVASLAVVYGWVKKLIKPNGFYIAWKGGEVRQEIEQLKKKNKNTDVEIVQMDERFVHSRKDRVFVRVKRIESNERGEN